MKITFLMPPSLDGKDCADRCYGCNYGIYFLPHLPTLYMATILKNNGHSVQICDFAAKKSTISDFKKFVSKDDSNVYVFFSVFLSEKTDIEAKKLIQDIRKSKSNIKFVYCGTQATWAPEKFIDKNSYVIRGESEFILLELINNLEKNASLEDIKGISLIGNDNKIVYNPPRELIKNIDDVPIPDRNILDHHPYYNPKLSKIPHTAILTSRGCFGKCWYCVPNALSFARELEYKKYNSKKPIPRLHSVERVVTEFKELANQGFKSVSIIDDEFLWNDERTVKICEGIKDLNLEWSCLARPDMITERSIKAMAEAGCSYIDMGVESLDQNIIDKIGKNIKVEDIEKAINIIKKYNIEPEINVLIGATPFEKEETVKKTISEVEKLNVKYVLYSIAAPFPGTDFYYAAKNNGWMLTEDYVAIDPDKESLISYDHLSKETMEKLLHEAYRRHYFNYRYIINQLYTIKSAKDFKIKANTALNLLKRNVMRR